MEYKEKYENIKKNIIGIRQLMVNTDEMLADEAKKGDEENMTKCYKTAIFFLILKHEPLQEAIRDTLKFMKEESGKEEKGAKDDK